MSTLINVIKKSTECDNAIIGDVQGEMVDGSKITWTFTFARGQVEQESGILEIDEDGDMFIW